MDATDDSIVVLEKCRISPPSNTVGERSLPITFFDIGWMSLPFPVQPLFFYEYPSSKDHFIQSVIPKLKHSLSITLQHFFPFAGNLILSTAPNHSNVTRKPEIGYTEGDYVPLTFAECDLDFNDLTGNHPRRCNKFYGLIPVLEGTTKVSDLVKIPLFSIQVTLFPNSGFAIGITNKHVLCDATTAFHFLRTWAWITRCGSDEPFLASGVLPFYDRGIIPNSLDERHSKEPVIGSIPMEYNPAQLLRHGDKLRATIVITRAHINWLKKRVSAERPTLEHVSSFSVACAYIWSCIAKARTHIGEKKGEDELEMFCFSVDWRSRMNPPIPQSYFGNCVGPCGATTKSTLLSATNGFLNAVELLGKSIKETINSKDGPMKGREKRTEKLCEKIPSIGVAGTTKLKFYDLDFGWGKPKKYEVISIDYTGSISLNVTKESPEDIEIGLSLPAKQMEAFIAISKNELESLFSEQE